MKTFLKIAAGVVLGLALVGVSLYLFQIRPIADMVTRNKPQFAKLVSQFVECLETREAGQCGIYLSEKAKLALPSDRLAVMANAVKTKLGRRIDAALIEKSIGWTTAAMASGRSLSVQFQMKAVYERDAAVVESYRLAQTTGGPFLIEFFNFNSDQLIN